MIHYRDRTFCASPCDNRQCPRHKDNVPADTGGVPVPVAWGELSCDVCGLSEAHPMPHSLVWEFE